MAKPLQEQKVVESIRKQMVEAAVEDYSVLLSKSPQFCDFYNKNLSTSEADPTLNSAYKIIGSESPFFYNKIENFPIYGADKISLDLSEGTYGNEAEITATVAILPGTIRPFMDDMLTVTYFFSGETKKKLFRVTDVQKKSLGSKKFYNLVLTMMSEDISLIQNQIKSELTFSMTDYKENHTPILLKTDRLTLDKILETKVNLIKQYKSIFYERDILCFVLGILDKFVINMVLHRFFKRFKTLEYTQEMEICSQLLIIEAGRELREMERHFFLGSIYGYFEHKDKNKIEFDVMRLRPQDHEVLNFSRNRYNYFYSFPLPKDSPISDTFMEFRIASENFISNIINNIEYIDSNKELENLIINYINSGWFKSEADLDFLLDYQLSYNPRDFFLIPFLIQVLKEKEEFILTKINFEV
jgi:hypothetical protein